MISNSALTMRPQPMSAVRHREIWIGDLDGYLVVFTEPYATAPSAWPRMGTLSEEQTVDEAVRQYIDAIPAQGCNGDGCRGS
jgi:hypothetical protein